jgi:hypothetical protein
MRMNTLSRCKFCLTAAVVGAASGKVGTGLQAPVAAIHAAAPRPHPVAHRIHRDAVLGQDQLDVMQV